MAHEPVSGSDAVGRRVRSRLAAVAGVLALTLWTGARDASGQARGPITVSTTATLSILAGPVQHVRAGGAQSTPATNGMNLAVGDRILTGPRATALITFLDGSTVTVQPGSDVAVARAEVSRTRATLSIRINLGTVWARVVRLVDPDSGLSLESNTATASVHDGLIGGQQNADGSFVCWTQTPGLRVTDREGRSLVLQAGERTAVQPGQALSPAPFRVNQSTLRIIAPPGVLPLVLMPDKVRMAGFVLPGLEVNQVFGSRTGGGASGEHGIELPAGVPGPFLLVLESLKDGAETVSWAAVVNDKPVYQEALAATLAKGHRLSTVITLELDPATAGDPRTARVRSGSASPLKPFTGPLPGTILLSPTELEAARR